MKTVQFGQSDLHVTPIFVGTMAFGEEMDEALGHTPLHHALARCLDLLDPAEMYAASPRAPSV
jgi:aryl-alcohol dehydrogenase-like predicted oxidoreductase